MNRDLYNRAKKQKNGTEYSFDNQKLIKQITTLTRKENKDNISRTNAYARFFQKHKEIKWAFLASMVSRNAGWNITDLEGSWLPHVLDTKVRKDLFCTYERANWLIFSDAYPQLLLYEASKHKKKPLFHLLSAFYVSVFMENEWNHFWRTNDKNRIMTALIINEQNVIQKPVIEHPVYKNKVFRSLSFKMQDHFHFSSVLFPVMSGELYGFSVHNFRKLGQRISLGKKLGWLLFHPLYYDKFYEFSVNQPHTGSRADYEKYVDPMKTRDTPYLRTTFPIIKHHRDQVKDWYTGKQPIHTWFAKEQAPQKYQITTWYKKKRLQMKTWIMIENLLMNK